jgi:hypothetical protein
MEELVSLESALSGARPEAQQGRLDYKKLISGLAILAASWAVLIVLIRIIQALIPGLAEG